MALFTHHRDRFPRPARAAVVGMVLAVPLLILVTYGAQSTDSARAASSSELNRKLESVRSELREIRANIEKAEIAKKAALGDIAALDQCIVIAQEALDEANAAHETAARELAKIRAELDQVTAELAQTEQELAQTERDLGRQQEVFDQRLVDMYKSGGRLDYMTVLLDSSSLMDIVGRLHLLSSIAEHDDAMLGQIKSLKTRVEQQKQELQRERSQVAALEQKHAVATAGLQAVAKEREASLSEIQAARAAKEQVLAAAEKDRAAWARQEDELLAESDRISEQLRAASTTNTVKAGKGVLSWPLVGEITSGFGYRIHPIFGVRKMHTGIDIDGDMGDPIRAAAGGTVVSAGWRGGYGKCVVISHGGGLATLYAHQSEILVSVGETVERGEVIGKVGSTGYSTGPHLHFEVRVNGSPVDPLGYL